MVFVTSRQFSAPACPPNEVLAVPPPTVRGVVHREDLIRALEQLAEETVRLSPLSPRIPFVVICIQATGVCDVCCSYAFSALWL